MHNWRVHVRPGALGIDAKLEDVAPFCYVYNFRAAYDVHDFKAVDGFKQIVHEFSYC